MKVRLSLALALAAGCHIAHAEITSHFNSGSEGWLVVNYPFSTHVAAPATHAITYDAAFGQPAGSIRAYDEYAETGVAAPAAYLGDHSNAYGGQLTYDIYLRYTDGVDYPAVILNAGTFSLYYVAPSPPVNTWQTRIVPLTQTGWRYNSRNGTAATETQMRTALSNIAGLYIYTEWNTGSDDTSIDNVAMSGGCLADFNNDSFVNALDYDEFASLFEAGDIGADINHDSFVNALDYDEFASAFEAGC